MAVEIPGYADNLQPWSISVLVAATLLALVAVILRILARFEKRQPLWWDDWLIMWSMVSCDVPAVPAVEYGADRDKIESNQLASYGISSWRVSSAA